MEKLRKEFEATALPHMDAIYNAALRMAKNQTEAEDLVQDTYLRAYRFFDKFKPGTSMRAWLFKILKNTCINNFKKRAKTPEHVDFDQLRLLEDEPVSCPDPEEEILYRLCHDELMRAIDALPEEFRLVILHSDVEGFTYKETAEIVDCPIGTVMSRLHRGRRILRNMMREYASDLGYACNG